MEHLPSAFADPKIVFELRFERLSNILNRYNIVGTANLTTSRARGQSSFHSLFRTHKIQPEFFCTPETYKLLLCHFLKPYLSSIFNTSNT